MSGILFGRTTVAGLLITLTVVGCGQIEPGGSGNAGSGPVSETTVTPQPDEGQPNEGQPNEGQPDEGQPDDSTIDPSPIDTEVAWVPPGPGDLFGVGADDVIPEVARWFAAFRGRNCDAIAALGPERDQQQLYAGLGDACRAVLEDNDQLWPSAEVALQNVDNPTDPLDREARRLLRDLVLAHQRDPQANIRIVDPPPEDSSAPSTSDTPSPTSVTPTPRSFNSRDALRFGRRHLTARNRRRRPAEVTGR